MHPPKILEEPVLIFGNGAETFVIHSGQAIISN